MTGTVALGTATFDVSMPLHQAYIIRPQVTKIGSGLNDVVVNKIMIARSETLLTLTGASTFTASSKGQVDIRPVLVVHGIVYDEYTSKNIHQEGNVIGLTLVFPQALYEKAGMWQLRFLTFNAAGKPTNTTTFQFMNPGPS